MTKNHLLSVAVACLAFSGSLFAQNEAECSASKQASSGQCEFAQQMAENCPVAKKCNDLLTRWDAAAEKAASATEDQRAAVAVRVANVSQSCPVGSRMDKTMSVVHEVVSYVGASCEANAENCPLSQPGMAEKYPELVNLGQAYQYTFANLQQLTGYASGACSGAKSCDAKAVTVSAESECAAMKAECSESVSKAECSESAAKSACSEKAASCSISMAAKLGALQAEFATARTELTELGATEKNAIRVGFNSVAAENPMIGLMPETVLAIAESLDALDHIDAMMMEAAQKAPEVFANMPAEMHQQYLVHKALLKETRGLLTSMTEAMNAFQAPEKAIEVTKAGN
ncbi:MAG: hypothetical protein O3A20_04335 [Planctomycetota bacterium]|nr:hypothetical protein [Planctomycetota bacterium]